MKLMWEKFFYTEPRCLIAAFTKIEINSSQNFIDTHLFISYVNEEKESPDELPSATSEPSQAALPL